MMDKTTERVELHIHTNMSDAVSVIRVAQAFQTAIDMGHIAIGFANLNSVCDYWGVAYFQKKYSSQLKVIYGVETVVDGNAVTLLVREQAGLKALYEVLSSNHMTQDQRNCLLMSPSCWDGEVTKAIAEGADIETLKSIVSKYDYIEVSPHNGRINPSDLTGLYKICKQLNVPMVAVADCNYATQNDKLSKDIIDCFRDAPRIPSCFYTTEEMIDLFAGLGNEAAYEVVVANAHQIADSVGYVDPCVGDFPKFAIPGTEEKLSEICHEKLDELYGEMAPQEIQERLDRELSLIGDAAPLCLISYKLIQHLKEKGAVTGYRQSLGSTLIAYLLGISDVNPLPAHYYCPTCKHIEFAEAVSGYDLQEKSCPCCGAFMRSDGQDLPYEICMGLDGEKSVDIQLQTPSELYDEVKTYLANLVGSDRVAFTSDICCVSERLAAAYIREYADHFNLKISDDEKTKAVELISQVKRDEADDSTLHVFLPEGMSWEDITPMRPAHRPCGGINMTTQMDYWHLYEFLPKIEILHYYVYDLICQLLDATGTKIEDINYNDPGLYKLFRDVDTCGIPEFYTGISKQILSNLNDVKFSDLVRICGMEHSTNTWKDNAENLLYFHPFEELIGTREDVFATLQKYNLSRDFAYRIMECVRKGRFCSDDLKGREYITMLQTIGVPEWYIQSMEKVRYLIPRAHVAHYAKMAVTVAWFKVYHPDFFYTLSLNKRYLKEIKDLSVEELIQKRDELDENNFREWFERDTLSLLIEARQRGYYNQNADVI